LDECAKTEVSDVGREIVQSIEYVGGIWGIQGEISILSGKEEGYR
jgi:hypothetical protein